MLDQIAEAVHPVPDDAMIDAPAMAVFAHLARDKDLDGWRASRAAGTLVGLNDETPYGYGRAERMGCRVAFSRSGPEGIVAKVVRLGLRVVLGFDLVHAWRQRDRMGQSDVVWTHTESQFLAAAAILGARSDGPILIGQSVWLFDRWPRLGRLRRALYAKLIRRVGLLTVHSDENLAVARSLFPGRRIERVLFGIPSECPMEPVARPFDPIRIVAVGNDRDRDWATLVEAARGQDDIEVSICSATADRRLAVGVPNVSVGAVTTNDELQARLAEATAMCVPLGPNRHASGITVIQEGVLAGLPVIATDTGGLRGYFGGDEIRYVPPNDAAEMRAAIRAVGRDPDGMRAMAVRAQARMKSGVLGAEAYIRRHVDLSRELLAERRR